MRNRFSSRLSSVARSLVTYIFLRIAEKYTRFLSLFTKINKGQPRRVLEQSPYVLLGVYFSTNLMNRLYSILHLPVFHFLVLWAQWEERMSTFYKGSTFRITRSRAYHLREATSLVPNHHTYGGRISVFNMVWKF